jgi:hypothetical protein
MPPSFSRGRLGNSHREPALYLLLNLVLDLEKEGRYLLLNLVLDLEKEGRYLLLNLVLDQEGKVGP